MSSENALVSLIAQLEQDRSLDEPRHLRQRIEALDDLDAYLPDGQVIGQFIGQPIGTALCHRAKAIYDELESVNFTLYEAIRRDIQRGTGGASLLDWIPDWPDWNAAANLNCRGYDYLDELISGVLQFEEPTVNNVRFIQGDARAADLSDGTVFYLYTPFTGTILRDVLNSLRHEAASREIRICTFGPCTRVVAEEQWLSAIGPLETARVAIFRSRD
jgi:hypothetical protein